MPVRTTVVREAGGTPGAGGPTRSVGPATPAPAPAQKSTPGNLDRVYRARERASESAPARESAPRREAAPAPQREAAPAPQPTPVRESTPAPKPAEPAKDERSRPGR